MRIIFITGNPHKLREAKEILHSHDVEPRELDLPEIQSLDPKEIVAEKLKAARKKVKAKDAAILVEDVSFWIGSTGLPGPLIKWFIKTVGRSGLVAFARVFGATRARAECNIGVLLPGKRKPHFFTGIVEGRIVGPRGESGFGFDPIFIPDGNTKTYAEMGAEQKNAVSHRRRALAQLEKQLRTNVV